MFCLKLKKMDTEVGENLNKIIYGKKRWHG